MPNSSVRLDLDYTQIDDIADLYIDELDEPQQLVDLVEGSPYRMAQVANALLRRPRYTNAGGAEYRHAIELSIEAERLNPTPQNLGHAGLQSLELQKPADAEQFFTAALKLDSAEPRWHIGRAGARAIETVERCRSGNRLASCCISPMHLNSPISFIVSTMPDERIDHDYGVCEGTVAAVPAGPISTLAIFSFSCHRCVSVS